MRSPERPIDDALGALYERACQRGFGLALAITGDPQASEDIVHEVFVRVLRRRERLQGEATLDPYVIRSVRNAAYDHLRRRRTAQAFAATYERVADTAHPAESPEPLDPTRISAALGELPPVQREVVHLRYFEGLSSREIARATGVPLGTVHSRHRYAVNKLRDLLAEEAPDA